MELKIYQKTDSDLYKKLRDYNDEEILLLYLNNSDITESVYGSNQEIDSTEWYEHIEFNLNSFENKLPKHRRDKIAKKRGK